MKRIKVSKPLVILHGDEMAQVSFERVIDTFVTKRLDIKLIEMDLSAENRLSTNGAVVKDAIAALIEYGVGIKNAGMTVNKAQLDELLSKNSHLTKSQLDPLATKSPNGAIRKGIGGNITREDIPFRNLKRLTPDWIGRDIDVDTMDTGGNKHSHNEISKDTGIIKLVFVGASGDPIELHRRKIYKGDPWLLASNDNEEVKRWAHNFFKRAIEEKRDAYLGLKDTVIPGYDGVMRETIEAIFEAEYKKEFEKAGISYFYELIDAQAARIVSNPPERALWGVPENTSGRKLFKLVKALKKYGIPDRRFSVSISRMSAGGGDQYGSFNMPVEEDGLVKIILDGKEMHARELKKGDPVIFMANHRGAIKDWVSQVFRDAARNDKEIYFGLKREYMEYDDVFSTVINEVRQELVADNFQPPSFMIMRPSSQLKKMITDPPRKGIYPSLNLDGDIFSDISAALGGSLATASSMIESKDGTMLYEAPHGTAHDLYLKYLESEGKVALFNPSALLFAVANALELLGVKEQNPDLTEYSEALKTALIDTVAQGVITADLKGKTNDPASETIVDMYGFLDAIEKNLDREN
ncbi:isocitrate/isopropylmalate family dehydrogenase [Ketobacter nezhaii]|uniref:isocitrate/isopropylmalate family dehydrogenase n=1 Tax=Ketobacter sp. MCCC 1A13808 TaxID=2602738 RepID=UPI00294FFA9E|nr:isocitrate/isopropylmalate family dehydrogenase [Ketobacter sp. MCCC 1A13808]